MKKTGMSSSAGTKGTVIRSWLRKLLGCFWGGPENRDQLIELLRDAKGRRLLDSKALSMMEGVLQVSEMRVRDISQFRFKVLRADSRRIHLLTVRLLSVDDS